MVGRGVGGRNRPEVKFDDGIIEMSLPRGDVIRFNQRWEGLEIVKMLLELSEDTTPPLLTWWEADVLRESIVNNGHGPFADCRPPGLPYVSALLLTPAGELEYHHDIMVTA